MLSSGPWLACNKEHSYPSIKSARALAWLSHAKAKGSCLSSSPGTKGLVAFVSHAHKDTKRSRQKQNTSQGMEDDHVEQIVCTGKVILCWVTAAMSNSCWRRQESQDGALHRRSCMLLACVPTCRPKLLCLLPFISPVPSGNKLVKQSQPAHI